MKKITNHAKSRMEERDFPPERVLEVIHTGKRLFRIAKNSIEYRKIIDGKKHVVITNLSGVITTVYQASRENEKHVSDTRSARVRRKIKLQEEKEM